jgi:hypothetical protein
MIALFLLFSLFFLPLAWEITRQMRRMTFDGLFLINISYAIVYGYPGFMYFFTNESVLGYVKPAHSLVVSISCIISYLFALIGYKIAKLSGASPHAYYIDPEHKALKKACWLSLATCSISIAIYSSQYGGIDVAITYSAQIRAGHMDDFAVDGGSLLFFVHLIQVGIFVPAVYVSLFFQHKTINYLIFSFASLTIVLLGTFLTASRGGIIILLAIIVLSCYYYIGRRGKLGGRTLIIAVLLIIPADFFLTHGYAIFNSLYKENITIFDIIESEPYTPFKTLTNYFEDRTTAIVVSVDSNNYPLLYFYDLIAMPLYVIPTRLIPIPQPDAISYHNSFLHTGLWIPFMPPGLVAYGMYSLSIPGVVLVSIAFGFFPGFMDGRFATEGRLHNQMIFVRIPLLFYWIFHCFQGDPSVLIKCLFPSLLSMLIYSWLVRIPKNRRWTNNTLQLADWKGRLPCRLDTHSAQFLDKILK